MKAVVSVTFDDAFVVHDIKVIEGQDKLFIAMPSRKTMDGEFKDIAHPINVEMREALQTAVDAAQAAFNDTNADQQTVNEEVIALEKAIEKFEDSQNVVLYEVIDVSTLIADETNWTAAGTEGTEMSFQNGQLNITNGTGSDQSSYTGATYSNKLFNFKYKVEYLDESGSSWGGIYLQKDAELRPWASAPSVIVCIKENAIEVQKWGSGYKMLYNSDDVLLESGKEYDITFGMYAESDTEVRIILRVDGTDVYNEVIEDSSLATANSYFGVFSSIVHTTLGEITQQNTPTVSCGDLA